MVGLCSQGAHLSDWGLAHAPLDPGPWGFQSRSLYGLERGLCSIEQEVSETGGAVVMIHSYGSLIFSPDVPRHSSSAPLSHLLGLLHVQSSSFQPVKWCWEGAVLGWGLGEQEYLVPERFFWDSLTSSSPMTLSWAPGECSSFFLTKSRATPDELFTWKDVVIACYWPTWSWGSSPSSAASASMSRGPASS